MTHSCDRPEVCGTHLYANFKTPTTWNDSVVPFFCGGVEKKWVTTQNKITANPWIKIFKFHNLLSKMKSMKRFLNDIDRFKKSTSAAGNSRRSIMSLADRIETVIPEVSRGWKYFTHSNCMRTRDERFCGTMCSENGFQMWDKICFAWIFQFKNKKMNGPDYHVPFWLDTVLTLTLIILFGFSLWGIVFSWVWLTLELL